LVATIAGLPREEGVPHAFTLQILPEQERQLAHCLLVTQAWNWRHKELAVDDLVPVAVVGQRVDVVDRPLPRKLWHVHTIGSSAPSVQVRMPHDGALVSAERHRSTARRTICSPGRQLDGDEILEGKGLRLRGNYYIIQHMKQYRSR
jgi:hypothetical protein